ncbi:MAG: hypothetical protein EXQ67_08035 [Thermoleophilia bacterium]|nr:hypothetical protein [Thermoleophilia bacterium]
MDEHEYHERNVRAERAEQWFVVPTTVAALLAIPAVIVPLIWTDPAVKSAGLWLDWLIWGVFVLEVLVLLPLATTRIDWLRHHRLTLFILFAAWPGWITVFEGSRFEALIPILVLAQKLLKLVKIDRFFRLKGTHQFTGTWLLIVPGAVAVVVVGLKLGWIGGLLLTAALLLGVIGPGGKPHPRLRRLFGR